MGDAALQIGIILFTTVAVILAIMYFYCRKSLSYFADKKSPELEIIIFIKNAQDEIEGIVRNFYHRQVKPSELWIVDCGSEDQTPEILQKLSGWFPGLRLLFLSDMPLKLCIQEVLKHTNAPALLLIDGTYLNSEEVLKIDNFITGLRKMS